LTLPWRFVGPMAEGSRRVPMADASVLVTGASGFIGSHLCEALWKAGARVVAAGPVPAESNDLLAVRDSIEVVPIRLTAPFIESLFQRREFDYVFHFAGSSDPRASIEAPVADFRLNADLTLSLLEACRKASRIPSVVLASSAAVYGHSRALPLIEAAPTEPITPYGASKLTTEIYARTYSHRFAVPTASMRIFSAYGPRLRRQVVHDFLVRLIESPTSLTVRTTGDETRDFVFVDDIVTAAMTIASSAPLHGEPYNVGSGTETSIRALAELSVERLGLTSTITFASRPDSVGPARWCADVRRLRNLGWRPTVRIENGVARTADWLSENLSTQRDVTAVDERQPAKKDGIAR
jgi:UDP-glucose 4-epimerase